MTNLPKKNMNKQKELKNLIGEHLLSGVDTYSKKIAVESYYNFGEDCNCISFVLDSVTYTAIENPSDGYRSSMKKLEIDNVVVKNTFPPIKVVGRMKPNDDYGVNDVLEFINLENGKTVLEVGTSNVEDYYPYFVANFYPENL